MKFKFDSKLQYQLDAIESTVNLFKGQKRTTTESGLVSKEQIVSNILELTDSQILENLQEVQKLNKINVSTNLDGRNFSIEMETGTGKTYVYLRTILELNKKYGFKKFIIIVKTVAVKLGTQRTLKDTEKHFEKIFKNTPYSFSEYDSKKILKIKQFARNPEIEIIVMTIDSFNKEKNIMNNKHDKIGAKPIELLAKTKPILILDEPQNMDTLISNAAIEEMNPLFTLRYSATHKKIYNLVYQLNPFQAYQNGLVKKIEVVSSSVHNNFNDVLIVCHEIKSGLKEPTATISVNTKLSTGFKVKKINVKNGENLFDKTKLPEYKGFIVDNISAKEGQQEIRFENIRKGIKVGDQLGGNREELMKEQIEKSVKEHFLKYHRLKKQGIKVLTLFFIDKVSNYQNENGIIRQFFIDAFNNLKQNDEYFKDIDVNSVHGGYFSKKRLGVDGEVEDKEMFNLIMNLKDRLLSFEEPVQFIFSHSALREGWDSPNVFNICTLNQTASKMKKRQEIGRGVRLPVNQNGERITDSDLNVLTVFANESYETYAAALQKEYVEEFGEGNTPIIQNRDSRKELTLKSDFKENPYFKKLWDKISQKATYNVKIDESAYVKDCIKRISNDMKVEKSKIQTKRTELKVSEHEGIKTNVIESENKILNINYKIPNIVEILENDTKITRKIIVKILSKINNLELIFNNPKEFLEEISKILKDQMNYAQVDGIEYELTGEKYDMKDFKDPIESYENKIVMIDNSIYDGIVWESEIEKRFAEGLDSKNMKIIKILLKLPKWYKIKTPMGTYNPDWAVVKQNRDEKDMKFIVFETKGTKDKRALTPDEQRKIECGEKYFKVIDDVTYHLAKEPDDIFKI
jgi:type III restriction enzyme